MLLAPHRATATVTDFLNPKGKDEGDDAWPDFARVQTGEIPWTGEEFWAVADHEQHLIDTPHDDWDRRPKRFAVDLGRGPEVYGFNPDMRLNQVMDFLVARYRHLDRTTVASHMNRYMVIKEFMATYRPRFKQDGLIQAGDGAGEEGIAMALIDVLATARLDAEHANKGSHLTPTFDYARVVAEAKRRMAAEEDEGGAPSTGEGAS